VLERERERRVGNVMGLVADERIRDEKKIGNENSVSGSCELECVCVW
jgi:hypothetical protein